MGAFGAAGKSFGSKLDINFEVSRTKTCWTSKMTSSPPKNQGLNGVCK